MKGIRPHRWSSGVAKTLFGAFFFLLIASYFALPCLTVDGGMFQTAAHACSEHKLFEPQADLARLSGFLPAAPAFRFLIVLPIVFAVSGLLAVSRPEILLRLRQRLRFRPAGLPFATADPPKLPAFAAVRDI